METTTRDIAGTSKIAAGTLFNYFPTKEALAMTIVSASLDAANEEFKARLLGGESLEEALFAHVATGLRHLGPYRGFVGGLMESTLSPFRKSAAPRETDTFRRAHLETVRTLMVSHGPADASPPALVTLHLYWTLFLGVLGYWVGDDSPNQEDTLVLLDQSMQMFVNAVFTEGSDEVEVSDGPPAY